VPKINNPLVQNGPIIEQVPGKTRISQGFLALYRTTGYRALSILIPVGKTPRIEYMLGAFFAAPPQKTGLSAPIFASQKFRSYPLRGRTSASLRMFAFGVGALCAPTPGMVDTAGIHAGASLPFCAFGVGALHAPTPVWWDATGLHAGIPADVRLRSRCTPRTNSWYGGYSRPPCRRVPAVSRLRGWRAPRTNPCMVGCNRPPCRHPCRFAPSLYGVRGAAPRELRKTKRRKPFGSASLPARPCGFAASGFLRPAPKPDE
jgi:hypothetical protein